jgi:pre-mRNA-processing factor SLU7
VAVQAEEAAAAAQQEANNEVEEFAEDGEEAMIGQHFDAKTRMTVRNLRIREDTAKYLYNLDPNSAYYDPKSRSMRMDPLPHLPTDEKPFAGDNFVRSGGDSKVRESVLSLLCMLTVSAEVFNEVRKFAWEAQEKGMDVDEVGAPSLAIKKFQEYQEKRKETETSKTQVIMAHYGGQEHAKPVPLDMLMSSSDVYREYAPDGSLRKGPQPLVPSSRFEENVLHGNHTAVWGSFWQDFKWGYACCHQFVKNSVCTGDVGKKLLVVASSAAASNSEAASSDGGDKVSAWLSQQWSLVLTRFIAVKGQAQEEEGQAS